MMMVPLRTGRVLFAVAWAASEGPNNFGNTGGKSGEDRRKSKDTGYSCSE